MKNSFDEKILEEANDWVEANQKVILATVIQTWGSSPRPTGSRMIVNEKGDFSGSVSGGCVESAVVRECLGLIKENKDYLGSSEGPGAIIFRYGEQRMHNITEHAHLPESGDLFIFPFNLMHYVIPFKSKGERISVAANFITDLSLSKGVKE